jgi:predicted kinase
MKKMILVMGHLAAGKSTFANNLAKKIGALVLVKDDIKEILGDEIGFSNREENLKLSFATFSIMKYVLLKSLESNDVIILESNFRPNEIKTLNEIASSHNIEVTNFILTADPDVLLSRYIERNKDRHIVHTSVGLSDPIKFRETLVDFTTYELIGKTHEVDTTDFGTIDIGHYADLI